ncbi:MAG TPA: cupredoxin domain-containing protein [Streptosporangiaceae bacterium]|nr:cupredoxin domain-containing protein [Streptosporangiaceae bacterium]
MRLLQTTRAAGAGLLAATGGIHLDLYLTGYRHIPTIGWLFLLQIIAAFALAIAVPLVRSPLTDAAGAGFGLATLGGYLLSLWVGLFGFQEVRTTAGLVAGLIEVALFLILGLAALVSVPEGSAVAQRLARLHPEKGAARRPGGATIALGGAAVVALVVLAVSVGTASSGSSPASATATGGSGGGAVVKIIIKNFKFTPANPDVKPGERIAVTNEDSVTHTLTAGPSPKDKGVFSTGDVGSGQTKMVSAPAKAGMYPFYCTIHTFMTGILIVGK